MNTIIGISGSLRRGSYNTALLAAAKELMPEGTTLEITSIREIPLYDGDWEAEHGLPESVRELKERIASSNGLLIATPEYNHSIPGVAKNAVDWLTRPQNDIRRVFGGLAVALMGATPGRGATMLAQNAWLPILQTLGTRPWFGRTLQIAGAAALFGDHGLHDGETRTRLQKFIHGFAAFAATNQR